MVQVIKQSIRRGLRGFGLHVQRYAQTLPAVRARVLSELSIDLVLDVGANRGQYASELRSMGYRGRIISFEPLPSAFAELSTTLASDPLWEGLRLVQGRLISLDAHLDRLYEGATSIALDIGLTRAELTQAVLDTLAKNAMTDGAHVRLMVTRGVKRTPNQDPRFVIGKATTRADLRSSHDPAPARAEPRRAPPPARAALVPPLHRGDLGPPRQGARLRPARLGPSALRRRRCSRLSRGHLRPEPRPVRPARLHRARRGPAAGRTAALADVA